ncbi:uncharacterized protein [Nicotiana tomentosiformis]|uniref:uncharacterized protein n=1 Tax=Nicotiana tomentosiformis TaxID=4098 RepID=UPI00388C7A08
MSVTDYKARFSELSRHVLMILPTDAKRVRRFVAGLHYGSQATMAREVEMGTSYELVVEIARRIDIVRQRSREQVTKDKRFRYSGEISGAPAGGWGFLQGYSGYQDQTSGQLSSVPRGCYKCGDLGHMKRFCPRFWGNAVQQGHQPIIIAPAAIPAIWPPRGRGQVDKGRLRGGSQTGGGQSSGAPARFYAFLARADTVASDAVITDYMAFLGYVVSSEGIKVDPKKTEAVQSWPRPTTATEIRSFLGLAGYYRWFIEGFSSIVAPLTRLTKKGAPFRWSDDCEVSFQKLKTALAYAPMLVLPSGSWMYTVYYDASRVGLGGVLM